MSPQSFLCLSTIVGSVRAAVPFILLSLCGAAKPPALTQRLNRKPTIPQQHQDCSFTILESMAARLQLILSRFGISLAGVADSIVASALHTTGAAVQFEHCSIGLRQSIARLVVVKLAAILLTEKAKTGLKFREAYEHVCWR
jgi:hypothetical protein